MLKYEYLHQRSTVLKLFLQFMKKCHCFLLLLNGLIVICCCCCCCCCYCCCCCFTFINQSLCLVYQFVIEWTLKFIITIIKIIYYILKLSIHIIFLISFEFHSVHILPIHLAFAWKKIHWNNFVATEFEIEIKYHQSLNRLFIEFLSLYNWCDVFSSILQYCCIHRTLMLGKAKRRF